MGVRQSRNQPALSPGADIEALPETGGRKTGLGFTLGWHTFRHTYRAWLDDTGAPMTVQQQLMRHASIQTIMNVYGSAMPNTKREANRKIVQMVIGEPKKPTGTG